MAGEIDFTPRMDLEPGAAADGALERARVSMAIGRPKQAVEEARRALALDPHRPDGYALLGHALLTLARPTEAREAAERGLALDPHDEWLLRVLSIALLHEGDALAALDAAEKAVQEAPDLPGTHDVLATALAGNGRKADAIAAVNHAITLGGRTPALVSHLGLLQLETAPKVAEQCFRECLRETPDDANTLNNLGVALERQKRHWEAVTAYRAAIAADPTLDLAKENTHGLLSRLLKVGGPAAAIGTGALVKSGAFKAVFAINALRFTHVASAWGLASVVALVAAAWGGYRALGWYRIKRLSQRDPQLYAIYQRLEADRRAGRLGRGVTA